MYGFIVRSWMSTFCVPSLPWESMVRCVDAFVCSGIWFFPALYTVFLDHFGDDEDQLLQREESDWFCASQSVRRLNDSTEEANTNQVLASMRSLDPLLLEDLFLEATRLAYRFPFSLLQRSAAAGRVDRAEQAAVDAAPHRRRREHSERVSLPLLLRAGSRASAGLGALQGAHALPAGADAVAGPAFGVYDAASWVSRVASGRVSGKDEVTSRRAQSTKPTLLLMQVEHTGNLIGLYREDRWSMYYGARGIPDTLLFSIEFSYHHGERTTVIRKWVGGGVYGEE